MITKTIEITEISVNELTDIIAEKLFNKLKMYLADYKSSEEDVFLSPKETAEFLKISRGTLLDKNKKINYLEWVVADITIKRSWWNSFQIIF